MARAVPTAQQAGPTSSPSSIRLEVLRFGHRETIEVGAEEVVTFPQGLVGMEALRRFAVLDDARLAPCRWLQSLDDLDLAFVVVDPHLIMADYLAGISGDEALQLELEDVDDADLLAIVTVRPDPAASTVNLLAPLVINRRRRLGKQVILNESGYALRHPLAAASGAAQ
jgi:flagellar assembly factor FliW